MSLAGTIGVALLLFGFFATLLVGLLRRLLVPWCPGCAGRGAVASPCSAGRVCDVCTGTGILRVADAPPADWFPGG